jgi:nucleotide-binding universal stress UspA family protein
VSPKIVLAIEPGTAERVARTGGEVARALGARIVLAHVRSDPPLFNSRGERERARHLTVRRGRAILDQAYAALPDGVEADERIELGVAVTRLRELASEADAALMVVGSRGRGPLASAILGSVSQALAQQAPCPVMIVPDAVSSGSSSGIDGTRRELSTIVAAVDNSSSSGRAARFARELADRLGGEVRIVPIDAAADPPAVTVPAIAAREEAKLIVIAARLGAGGGFTLSGSLSTRVTQLARQPVIVIPEEATTTLYPTGETVVRRAA